MDNYLNTVIGDRYEIQEVIGIGGMSVVYKAYDRLDDRIVAVKILKDEFMANEEFRMRFRNESKAISILSHPNIVKVYDVSFGETMQYIVMEYVEGITLKEYIERQKVLDTKEAVHFVVQILRALQHAHDKGIVHRDIKPQNIILLPNANIKVTDFGIARFNHVEALNVNESSAIGSVHYVSPEQAKGEHTDHRSDIYSVGVVLYEMLTGKVPFEGENDSSVALMQLQNNAKRPSLLNPSIPIGLEQITLRALQKDPMDRYQSAAEFLSDLYDFKQNPQIKFDYTYFVDSDPTKHISAPTPTPAPIQIPKPAPKPVLTTADIPVRIVEEEEYGEKLDEEADEEEESERSLTIPILIGIVVALILLIVAVLGVAFGSEIKEHLKNGNSIFSFFTKEKTVEVPNFINMNIDEVLKKYPDFVFKQEEQKGLNSTVDPGTVIKQSPEAGEKISADTVIILTIAAQDEMIPVPSVKDKTYAEAESILVAKGFKVELQPAFFNDVEEDIVVYTSPKEESFAPYGSTVYVYYASEAAKKMNKTHVPDVLGDQLSVAKQKIVAAGLRVGAVTEDASPETQRGFVIGQNPSSGESVDTGTVINLVVGNGVQGSSTATFQITLPDMNGRKGTVRTYLNGQVYDTFPDVVLDGSTLQISFTGADGGNEFNVFVDSSKYLSGEIDFSKSKDKVTNVVRYSFTEGAYIPNVVGMSEADAVAALREAGFTNINTEVVSSEESVSGRVVSQTPVSTTLTQYSVSTKITIYIANRHGGDTPDNPTDPVESDTDPSEGTSEPSSEYENTEPEPGPDEPDDQD